MEKCWPCSIPAAPAPTRIPSPSSPVPILCRRRRRRARCTRREAQRCSTHHPSVTIVSIASPPLLLGKRKRDVSPSTPLKHFRGNKSVKRFIREPYEAAIDRERAASVAAALEHAFWEPKLANTEGAEMKIEDYLIAMTGAKLAKLPLFE